MTPEISIIKNMPKKKEIKQEVKAPTNSKEIKAAKSEELVLDGVIKYKNGYAIMVANEVKEVCPGLDGFAIACKRYKLYL